MYILEQPSRGILMELPDSDKPQGTWSWSKPRSEALKIQTMKRACYVRDLLPTKVRVAVSVIEAGTWLIAMEAKGA